MKLTVAEQMMLSTVLIEAKNGKNESAKATGFLFTFHDENRECVHSVITSRHVLEQCKSIKIFHQTLNQAGTTTPKYQNFLGFDNRDVIFHPDRQIDLAAIPISEERIQSKNLGTFLDRSFIPDATTWNKFDVVEELIMIGYPFGIIDKKHNLPILRRGATGTHPAYDYNGIPYFLADMACYSGSSGSPVFLYDANLWKSRSNEKEVHPLLMGIQSKGFFAGPNPELETCLHLGKIVKSTQLLDFAPLVSASRIPAKCTMSYMPK